MYWNQTERKHVLVTSYSRWGISMGLVFELYQASHPWAVQARVINKAAAEQYLQGGIIRLNCDDADVCTNLRMRYRQSHFVPDELPETCTQRDSVLLVRKRELDDSAEAGYDSRYHFFLITWMDSDQASIEFADAHQPRPVDGSKRKHKKPVDEVVSKDLIAAAEKKKQRHRKGMSAARYATRWRG